MSVPTLEQFKDACREAFAFLVTDYSFREVPPARFHYGDPFVVCFSNDSLTVVVEGGNYGSTADVLLEDASGRAAHFGYIEWRDLPQDRFWTFGEGGQLHSIAQRAERLRTLGARLLAGDMSDFEWILQQQAMQADKASREDELLPMRQAAQKADEAFALRDFKSVIKLLAPFSAQLAPLHHKKLQYATKNA